MSPGLRVAAASLAVCWIGAVVAPAPAAAYFDEDERMLDRTAYALRQGEIRLGFFNQSVGVFDQLTIGTLTLPWVLPLAIGRFGPNLFVESAFLEVGPHAVSLRAGVTYVAVTEGGEVATWIVPITAAYSYRVDDHVSLHFRAGYAGIFAGANASQEDQEIEGNALIDNVQLDGSVEWRLTRSVALVGTVHYAPWTGNAVAEAEVTLSPVARGSGELEVDNSSIRQAWNVMVAVALSMKVVDLRVGFGYGDPFILDTGVVLGYDDFFPEIALDFRFP